MTRPEQVVGIDHVAVQRAIGGDCTVELHKEDRREVVRVLYGRGLDDLQIERRSGIDQRTAQRIRTGLGLPTHVSGGHVIEHPGLRNVVDRTDRSLGTTPFVDGFMQSPFNKLIAETVPECAGMWDIFAPPEKPDGFPHNTPAHQAEERRRHAEARTICARCPIQAECLEFAMTPGERGGPPTEEGIWAGTTSRQRTAMHKKAQAVRSRASCDPAISTVLETSE